MIKKIFNYAPAGILGGAFVLALAALASRTLGFLRNALLAANFGASETLDAYFLAFRLPDLFFNLLFFGALSAGFVPVFIKLRAENSEKAWELANDIFNLALVAFSVFGILFFITAPWVLRWLAPGFSQETLSLAVTMSRIMFLQPIFLGVSGIFSGILQSTRKFLSYSLAPVFYNAGIIFGILVLFPVLGPVGLAWGVVAGAFLHMGVQYPATRSSGWRWRWVLSTGISSLRRVFGVMVPRSLSLIVQQSNLIILTSLATVLGAGSVAIFNFASDIYSFPLGILVVPLSVAAFPEFVSAFSRSREDLTKVFVRTLRQMLFFLVPLVFIALILRAQVVRLALGYGHFGWPDTVVTINVFTAFLLGLLFHGLVGISMRVYFAMEDAKTPLFIMIFGTVVTVGTALVARESIGASGLALGYALGMVFNGVFLLSVLFKRLGGGFWEFVRGTILYIVAGLGAAAISRIALYTLADNFVATETVRGLLAQATLATIAGGTAYIVFAWLLDIPEVSSLQSRLGLRPPEGAHIEPPGDEELPK